jgi:quercetin dioxygenase-like cupin family protein
VGEKRAMGFRAAAAVLALAGQVGGCAARPPLVIVGAQAADLDALLAARPLVPGQEIRADEVGRTAGASYHLVQVRGREAPHRHLRHDLAVCVLRGRGTLAVAAARRPLRAGDVAVVPRGTVHWFARGGRETAVALVVFTPPLDAPDSVPADAVDSPEGGG